MMEIINITWNCGRGQMQIPLDEFFPCAKKDLKKLLEIISLDWEHEEELKKKLKIYFQNKQTEHESAKKESIKQYFEYQQKEADTKVIVATGKHPNGVLLSKDELKAEKKNLDFHKRIVKEKLADYKQHEKNGKRFSEYLKLL